MSNLISNITVTENVTLVTLIDIPVSENILSKIFAALAQKGINVDMVSQTSPLKGKLQLSFTIEDNDLFGAIDALKSFKSVVPSLRIEVNSNNTKVSLFSETMNSTPGVFATTLQLLQDNDIDIIMITTSELDISYLIYSSDQSRAIELLNSLK